MKATLIPAGRQTLFREGETTAKRRWLLFCPIGETLPEIAADQRRFPYDATFFGEFHLPGSRPVTAALANPYIDCARI
jgi:hypothetical protein